MREARSKEIRERSDQKENVLRHVRSTQCSSNAASRIRTHQRFLEITSVTYRPTRTADLNVFYPFMGIQTEMYTFQVALAVPHARSFATFVAGLVGIRMTARPVRRLNIS